VLFPVGNQFHRRRRRLSMVSKPADAYWSCVYQILGSRVGTVDSVLKKIAAHATANVRIIAERGHLKNAQSFTIEET
jgi:hypothetical protein